MLNFIDLIKSIPFDEEQTTDFYILKLQNVLQLHEHESEEYKKALIKRMISTLNSITLLRQNNCYLETPVLLRVTFESTARLYQYTYHKSSVTRREPDAYKILGRSPGPNYAINRIGEGKEFLKFIYRYLCSFAHPDVLSLILSLEDEEKNETSIDMISRFSMIGILYMLSKVYPDDVDDSDFVSMILGLVSFIFQQTIIATQNNDNLNALNEMMQQGVELFADEEINDILKHLTETLTGSDGKIEVEEVLKESLTRYTSSS